MNSRIDFSSKRVQLALRFFSYGLMTLATAVLTAGAIFYTLGYRFSQSDLTFKQGGLLQIRTLPDGATVKVDSQTQSFVTPGQINLSAGAHTIALTRDGYGSWTKTITMQPGQLLRLNYPRLIPVNLTTQPTRQFGAVASVLASPDRRWMAVQETIGSPTFTMVDTSDAKRPAMSSVTIPEAQLSPAASGGYGQIHMVEWDANARFMLVRQDHDGTSDFIRIDRTNPDAAINISRQFRLNISDAHFSTTNSSVVYALTGDALRRVDVAGGSASVALITEVKQFSVGTNDTIVFVADRPLTGGTARQQLVGLYRGKDEQIIRRLEAGKPVLAAYSEYFGHAYLAVGVENNVQLILDPSAAKGGVVIFDNSSLGQMPQWLNFSPNGRILSVGAGSNMATYDIEVGEAYQVALPASLDADRPPQWLDNFYMWTDAGDRLRIFEFDGTNDRDITSVARGLTAAFSQDGSALFSFGSNATLQSTSLIAN